MANTDANDLGLEHHYSHAHPGTFSLRLYKEERKQALCHQGSMDIGEDKELLWTRNEIQ